MCIFSLKLETNRALKNSMVGGLCFFSLCDGLFSGARWVWGNVLCQTPNKAQKKSGNKDSKVFGFLFDKVNGWFWDNKNVCMFVLRFCLEHVLITPLKANCPKSELCFRCFSISTWFSGKPAVQSRGEYLMICSSGQVIATSAVTPNGGVVRESPPKIS